MVNALTSLTDFDRLFLGFDRMKHELANHGTTGNYPRYNIIKTGGEEVRQSISIKAGEVQYRIEMDLASWDKSCITIKQEDRSLTIEGKKKGILHGKGKDTLAEDERFIFKGISSKNFRRVFTLGEYVKIQDASMENGLLVVKLAVDTPEEEKPKFIDIS